MVFIDNKYTDRYYAIIENARTRLLSEGEYVEVHHIIPRSFFASESETGWLPGDANTSDNLIALTAREHFVCHRLLPKMTIGVAQDKMIMAIWYLSNAKDSKGHDFIVTARTYEFLRKELANTKGTVFWNNGVQTIKARECPGSEWVRGGLTVGAPGGTTWWNNGEYNTTAVECPGPGWVAGMIPTDKHKGRKPFNNGKRVIWCHEDPGGEWVPGALPTGKRSADVGKRISDAVKAAIADYQWWNDGVNWKFQEECPGEGWMPGRGNPKCWNNGREDKFALTCPGEGWTEGTLRIWWNNGETSTMSIECPGPGWMPGKDQALIDRIAASVTGTKHEIVICPKCGEVGGKNGMIRFHFDNCDKVSSPNKDKTAYNNGVVTKFFAEHPGKGWAEGSLQKGKSKNGTTGKTAYNNGIITKFFSEDPGGDWKKGSLQTNTHSKGRKWWNNGQSEMQSAECPGPDWNRGRLSRK